MAKIKQLSAREILNSKGIPTIETSILLSDDTHEYASCPSGTSVGTYEALELRDNDEKRFHGRGVLKAIENIEKTIAPALIGMDANNQSQVDKKMIELDGTQNKNVLGANAVLSVSMAVAKAAAKSSGMPLFLYLRQYIKKDQLQLAVPTPLFNLINGGKHAGDNVNFQEFLVIPATRKSYSESLYVGSTIYNSLKNILQEQNLSTLIGDEGGFGPSLFSNIDAFGVLKKAAEAVNYRVGFDVFFGLDAASNNFHDNHRYLLKDRPSPYSSEELVGYYIELNKQYPLLYLEDPLYEDDWEGWNHMASKISESTLVVGDDLTVTNPYRLQMAVTKNAISGIIIKPNQIGSVIEALAVVETARQAGLKIIVSHRSGETNDDFIADFAVAASADYVKFGAPARGERVAKYNRLLQIERQIQSLGEKK